MRGPKVRTLFASLLAGMALTPPLVQAHGAIISRTTQTVICVQATYDSGQPMAGAQMAVFSAADPTRARLTGIADNNGHYCVVSPPPADGAISIQARLAGHGAIIHIPADAERGFTQDSSPRTAAGYNTTQRVVMAASIVWGCIGTALYFAGRRPG